MSASPLLAAETRMHGEVHEAAAIAAPGDTIADALPLSNTLHPACTPLVSVLSFYRAPKAMALRRGRHPDLPPDRNKVTRTR